MYIQTGDDDNNINITKTRVFCESSFDWQIMAYFTMKSFEYLKYIF